MVTAMKPLTENWNPEDGDVIDALLALEDHAELFT